MRNILKYIFSILLITFFPAQSHAQVKPEKVEGIKIGVDISKILISYLKDKRNGFEIFADYQLNQHFFIAAEGGYESDMLQTRSNNDSLLLVDYKGSGYFGRIGFDYSFPSEGNDIMMVGFRTGYSMIGHDVKSITIADDYWGNYTRDDFSEKILNTLWVSGVFGLRAEIMKNFFMGYNININFLLYRQKDGVMPPYRIPGYGKGNKKVAFGASYMIYYRIPF